MNTGASRSIVTLISDFGLGDFYVGVMKGVILGRSPAVQIVDITHDISPQDIVRAAFALDQAWPHFPEGTVHQVVVDPGVGTERRRLAIAARGHLFVGPDNGCLSAALPGEARGLRSAGGGYHERPLAIPDGVTAVSIERLAVLAVEEASTTFEGRDIFAPASAFLADRGRLSDLGRTVATAVVFPAFRAPPVGDGLDGLILGVDRFGNLLTDILAADLPPEPVFEIVGQRIAGVSRTYSLAVGPAAIVGSSGRIEIALPRRSAAAVLGAGAGDRVHVRFQT